VGWVAARLYGARLAWLAVLVAGTLLHIWALGRVLTPDMFLTGWCTLAIAAWVETRHRGGGWGWWILQVLFWTLALWTKATPALVPLLGLALYVYLTGGRAARRALKLPLLLPLILLLGLPWFLYVVHVHPGLKDFYLDRELAARLSGHIKGRHEPVYYYLLTSLAAWLPWWPLALFALIRQRRRVFARGDSWRKALSLEVTIAGVGLLVFSAVPSKMYTYTLPLAPWTALAMSRVLMAEVVLVETPVLAGMVGATAVAYVAIALAAPHYESKQGRNSSLAQVTAFLHQQGAKGVHADHLWPSLEFYWSEDFHFTGVVAPVEIPADQAHVAEHFESAVPVVPGQGNWFIHYRKQEENPFRKWMKDPATPKTTIGDFVVGPLE